MAYNPFLIHIARTAKPLGDKPAPPASKRTKRNGPSTLTNEKVARIKRDLLERQHTDKELAALHSVSIYQVRNIKSGVCYADVPPATKP